MSLYHVQFLSTLIFYIFASHAQGKHTYTCAEEQALRIQATSQAPILLLSVGLLVDPPLKRGIAYRRGGATFTLNSKVFTNGVFCWLVEAWGK